jgi:hypothetical protein
VRVELLYMPQKLMGTDASDKHWKDEFAEKAFLKAGREIMFSDLELFFSSRVEEGGGCF